MPRYQRYFTEEDKQFAIKCNKTRYMNAPWHCKYCRMIYKKAGSWQHIKTKMHLFKQETHQNHNI